MSANCVIAVERRFCKYSYNLFESYWPSRIQQCKTWNPTKMWKLAYSAGGGQLTSSESQSSTYNEIVRTAALQIQSCKVLLCRRQPPRPGVTSRPPPPFPPPLNDSGPGLRLATDEGVGAELGTCSLSFFVHWFLAWKLNIHRSGRPPF